MKENTPKTPENEVEINYKLQKNTVLLCWTAPVHESYIADERCLFALALQTYVFLEPLAINRRGEGQPTKHMVSNGSLSRVGGRCDESTHILHPARVATQQ